MSSKETQAKVRQDLKNFFKQNKQQQSAHSQSRKSRDDLLLLTSALEYEISEKNSINQRMRVLRDLSDKVLNQQLEDNALEKLYLYTEDILRSSSKDHRNTVLYFYQCLVQGQYPHLRVMRRKFFDVVKNSENMEDAVAKFELFKRLTDNGKDLLTFEEEVGHFLLDWTPVIVAAGKAIEFLRILVNYIKYNAAYTDDDIINGIVQYMTYLCCQSDIEEVVKEGLNVLDAIVCYSNISQQTMPIFIAALSRTICVDTYNSASWKIMRNLLGTHMGHFCLLTICKMLQESNSYSDIGLVCGMIFIINMALLQNKPDFIIVYIPNSILPSIQLAAGCQVPVIIMEVCVCMKLMVEKYGRDLKKPLWEKIFEIIDALLANIDRASNKSEYQKSVLELFTKIDVLFENGQFKGDTYSFFRLVNNWYPMVTETSVIRLIDHNMKFAIPIEEKWLENLEDLMHKFFEKETRTNVRVHVLGKFESVLLANRYYYEKDLIDIIVTPFFSTIPYENDVVVREAVIQFLLRISLQCSNIQMEPILNILERVIHTPFVDDRVAERCQKDPGDIQTTLGGLIDIFAVSIHRLPSSNAKKILSMLVMFLLRHYEQPEIFESVIGIRLRVTQSLLKLRSDPRYRLGFYTESTGLKFSSFLIIEHERSSSVEEDCASSDVSYISLSSAYCAIITVLKHELDWRILKPVLEDIPSALKYRALILSEERKDVDPLVKALTYMITDPPLDKLRNTPAKFSVTDLNCTVIPVLSAFASYHAHLLLTQQQALIQSLEIGFMAKSAPKCVTALMICLLEMRDAMTCIIPEVLLNLSKISATKHMAIPTLEFLSMLATFPRVYANFTSKQYMSVFAIICPYTSPFKYNHYTVSLAHHVSAVWFFRCRKPLRLDFVKFFIKGLRQNVLPPHAFENVPYTSRENLNEDSSNRKRSSSLTEQSNRRKERQIGGSSRLLARRGVSSDPRNDEMSTLFHHELTETCIDLMSRVTYSNCSALPRRFTSTDFFLHDGQSMTWLLGMTLITVTVSGCTQKPMRNGLCDKCCNCCLFDSGASDSVSSEGTESKLNESPSAKLIETPVEGQQVAPSGDEDADRRKRAVTDEFNVQDQCVCWCQGWAEIYVRRPTGDFSWVMRCQNDMTNTLNFDPLTDLSTLFHPYISDEQLQKEPDSPTETSFAPIEPSGISSRPCVDNTSELLSSASRPCERSDSVEGVPNSSQTQDEKVGDCCHGRNPVRRSNSSPEMNPEWKNKCMKESRSFNSSPDHDSEHGSESACSSDCRKGGKCYANRGNCEAIPEEFAGQGTTPPKPEVLSLIAKVNREEDPNSSSHQASNDEKSPEPTSDCNLLPSFSFDDEISKSVGRRLENRFFDKQSMPNEHFEFNRSASVSQVVPPFKKSPATASSTSHNLASSQPHLTTKPPLSPPTYSSKQHLASKPPLSPPTYGSKLTKLSKESASDSYSDSFSQLNDYKRNRLHTISVMNSSKKTQLDWESPKSRNSRTVETQKYGISPSFVFLQLYHSSHFGNSPERPILVPQSLTTQRAIAVFDRIPPYETHKVGVIYVGPGQANNEKEILRNSYGSVRYSEFLNNLGTLVNLAEVNPQNIFLGGLEQNGDDGKYAYVWKDDVMQVIFHIATLMPNKETDVHCSNKKKHIGNDYVVIVYNDSGEEYDVRTMKCQFNFACVVVEPLDHGSNQLTVKAKQEDLKEVIGDVEMKIVSDKNVSLLARQLALHINLASMIQSRLSTDHGIYASNWLERLRKIKHIKAKVMAELKLTTPDPRNTDARKQPSVDRHNTTYDFTDYTAYQNASS